MSDDFKQIPFATKYEIDKEGTIRTVGKQTPIIPYPLGGKEVRLETDDGGRKSFNIDELVENVFNDKPEKTVIVSEAAPSFKVNENKEVVILKPETEKIMALDTFMSVKMWKLHEVGLSNDEIAGIVKYPHSNNVPATIEKYKKNKTLRDRADKVQIK